MKNSVHLPIPAIKALRKLGKDNNNARHRRLITIELMTERSGLLRATIAKIENGDATTSIGGYVSCTIRAWYALRGLDPKLQ